MLGSALYYPNIDIEDGNWLRTAILFWDDIQTIVPARIEKPYQTADTRLCADEGYLRPLRPDHHPDVMKQLGERVRELVLKPEWAPKLQAFPGATPAVSSTLNATSNVLNGLHLAGIWPEKMSPELANAVIELGFARLHRGRIGPGLNELIDPDHEFNARRYSEAEMIHHLHAVTAAEDELLAVDDELLLVSCDFAGLYMAALATMLARDIDVVPLTNSDSAMDAAVQSLATDVAAPGGNGAKGALVNLVVEGLKVDPETPLKKLFTFRRKHALQLAELGGMLVDLSAAIPNCENRTEIKEKAGKIYSNKIRPALDRLKIELRNQSIQSAWDGFTRSATITVGAGSALAVFSGLSAPFLLATGAFLTGADVLVKTYFARQKTRANSPYTYLLDVERKFRYLRDH